MIGVKMKLWIWSDLHLERQAVALPPSAPGKVDAIVCAGDLSYACNLGRSACEIVNRYGVPLVFVPGNHEFYGTERYPRSKPSGHVLMKKAMEASHCWPQPLHVLDDGVVELGGVRFIGGTLWTDFRMDLEDDAWLPRRMHCAVLQLADFSRIRLGDGELLSPEAMLGFHLLTRAFVERQLAIPFVGKTVVVTHHLPHPDCTPPCYRGWDANFLFACSAEAFEGILNSNAAPALWVCGHTHHAIDRRVGRTRIVCNPFGYFRIAAERNNGFRWNFVVDTEELP
jgi:predicted phosphodiesterase